jgi:apolipoprotein N-acyltransferase
MVNITNDGWFGKSAELNQHLAIMAFRAVENRIALVRAANTGISAFVDINGRIYGRLVDENGQAKEVEGSLTNNVMINKRRNLSFYTRNGDLFAIASIVISISLLLWAVVKHYLDFRRTIKN